MEGMAPRIVPSSSWDNPLTISPPTGDNTPVNNSVEDSDCNIYLCDTALCRLCLDYLPTEHRKVSRQ